jgi:guanylate kinase
MSRLIILSGPSGVGKGPIISWMKKIYFERQNKNDQNLSSDSYVDNEGFTLYEARVYKSKTARTVEASGERIIRDEEELNGYEFDCRGARQGIDLLELDHALKRYDAVLLEVYYKAFKFLKDKYQDDLEFVSAFISPLDKEEIEILQKDEKLEKFLPDLLLDSLVERAKLDKKVVNRELIENLCIRAEDSIREIDFSYNYGNRLSNHCYEADPRLRFNDILGEPRRVVDALYDIVKNVKGDKKNTTNWYNYNLLNRGYNRKI